MRTLEQRFWEKVDTSAGPDECWPWTGQRSETDYGIFFLCRDDRRRKVRRYAHRIAYELATGEQLGDLQADHICHNRACCNPAHLRPVTAKQNSENRRGAARGNRSGVRGVQKCRDRWQARVKHRGEQFYLGTFATIEEAAAAARAARLGLFTHNDADRRSPDAA